MNLNKKQLVKVLLAVVISAALAVFSVFVAIHLGQAVLHWYDALAPRTRTYLTLGMLVVVVGSSAFVILRMRKKK